MKIAIVTAYPVGFDGGVQKHINDYVQKLIEQGHEVRVFSTSSSSEFEQPWHTPLGKYQVVRGNKYTSWVLANGSRAFYSTIGKENAKLPGKFDIIHIHEPLLPLFFYARSIAKANANYAKIIATVHATGSLGENLKTVLQFIVKKFFLVNYAHIIAISEPSATFYRGMGIPITKIPNGIDTNYFMPAKVKLPEYDDEKKNVLFLGRFDSRKGVEYLLRAWPQITKALKNNVRLILVRGGSPEENQRIFKIIETLPNKENIVFEGFVSEDRKRDLFRTADLMVAPSLGHEAQGIVLNEAMGCGTPVLGYANPGYAWVLEEKKDYCLAEVRNVEDLAQKAIQILQNEKLARELSDWGRAEVLKKFDWEIITKKIVGVYYQVLGLTENQNKSTVQPHDVRIHEKMQV